MVHSVMLANVMGALSEDSAFIANLLLRRGPKIHIPTSPDDELIQHVRGRGTVDPPHPYAGKKMQRNRLSSHDCIGDMSSVKPRTTRACVLRRVCLSTATGEMYYYRDDNSTSEPILFDQRVRQRTRLNALLLDFSQITRRV